VKPVFLFRIKTQFDNLGDALINRELMSLCAEQGKVFACVAGVPGDFKGWLKSSFSEDVVYSDSLFWFYLYFGFALLGSLLGLRPVFFVQNPGGYIGEISGKSLIGRHLKRSVLSLLKLFRVKSVLVGASYEGLGKNNLNSVALLSKVLNVHAVRDDVTLKYCREHGVRVTSVLPDLAFNLAPCKNPLVREKVCIVSLRDPKDDAYAQSLVAMLKVAHLSGVFEKVRLVYQVRRDAEFMVHFQSLLKKEHVPVEGEIVPLLDGVESNVMHYAGVSAVVSNRLHVLLLALRAGTPSVAVVKPGSNKKIIGIFSDVGLGDFCVHSNGSDAVLKSALDRFQEVGGEAFITRIVESRRSALKNGFKNMLVSA
jgi:Polysaccharide pyruvyl transferase